MRRNMLLVAAVMMAVAVGLVAQQPAEDPIKAASDALGVGTAGVVRFTAFGSNYTVGQAPSATEPWPKVTVKSYEATYNLTQEALRVDMTREQGPVPPRGGGVPFVGEQRVIQLVRGTTAWDEAVPAAPAGGRRGGGPPAAAEAGRVTLNEINGLVGIRPPGPPPPTPQPAAGTQRMLEYWVSPFAFLKGAAANRATVRKIDGNRNEVSFTVHNKYKLTGVLNSRNELEKVTTAVENPVLGDMPIEVTYSNYQKFATGQSYPLRVVMRTGGYPSLDLWLSSVQFDPVTPTFQDPRNAPVTAGAPTAFEIPANVAAAQLPPVNVANQQIANGVQWITGGSHHSVAIEMRDHVILVEAPQNEARVAPVLAKVKELFPNKPIRFVVNTHLHFDHSGGLRTAVAEGATVVTHGSNRSYYQAAWKAPRTLSPDKLSTTSRIPAFVPVTEKYVMTDTPARPGGRTVEIHRIAGNPHNDGFLMIYLPAEKILIEADAYTPPAPPAAAPAAAAPAAPAGRAGGAAAAGGRGGAPAAPPPPNPATVNLLQNIERLKLDVAQIAPLHGARLATMDDLRTAVNPPAPAAAPAAAPGGRQGGGAGL